MGFIVEPKWEFPIPLWKRKCPGTQTVRGALGNTDLIINVSGNEYLVETKIYRYQKQFEDGKEQLAYYAKSLGIMEAVYLVFVPNNILHLEMAKEGTEVLKEVTVQTYLVHYDEEKDF